MTFIWGQACRHFTRTNATVRVQHSDTRTFLSDVMVLLKLQLYIIEYSLFCEIEKPLMIYSAAIAVLALAGADAATEFSNGASRATQHTCYILF